MVRTRKNGMTRTRPSNGNGEVVPKKLHYSVSRKGMGGQPTKYDPVFCGMVVDYMSQGMSRYEVALNMYRNEEFQGVTYQTLLNWEKKYSEFFYALKTGEELSRGWWEQKARLALNLGFGEKFATGPWLINMINRFGWRSANAMVKEEQTSKIEHISKTEHTVNINVSGLPDVTIDKLMVAISQARTPEGKPIAAEPSRNTLH